MLYYDRIDLSQGIDVNKTISSKDYNVCHYWDFLEEGFRFQPDVCNVCHDVSMMPMNLSDIAMIIALILIELLAELAKLRLST